MISLAVDAIAASDRRRPASDRVLHLLRDLFQGSREFRQAAQSVVVHALQCALAQPFSSMTLKVITPKGSQSW